MDSDVPHLWDEDPGRPLDHQRSAAKDGDAVLARALGWSRRELIDLLGGGWGSCEVAEEDSPAGRMDWYVAGDPAQIMLALGSGRVVLAVPEGRWQGASSLHLVPAEGTAVTLALESLATEGPEIVRALQARRRRAFRWCRYCRTLVAPEERMSVDQCMGCASAWDGLVF